MTNQTDQPTKKTGTVMSRFRRAVIVSQLAEGIPVILTDDEAVDLLMYAQELERVISLVVAQFDGIEDDKWPTLGIRVAVDQCRELVEGM